MASIIKHFDIYPLLSEKQTDYELIKKAFYIIKNKEHLTEEGLYQIVAIKASLKLGLSSELTSAFSNVTPMVRPLVQNLVEKIDPY